MNDVATVNHHHRHNLKKNFTDAAGVVKGEKNSGRITKKMFYRKLRDGNHGTNGSIAELCLQRKTCRIVSSGRSLYRLFKK